MFDHFDTQSKLLMKWPTRILWLMGSFSVAAAGIAWFLSDWHWYTPIEKAEFVILSPKLSGFPAPYPDCEIAKNGISPDGQIAFILGYSIEERAANPPNCLVFRSRPGFSFPLPSEIGDASSKRENYYGLIRWAKNSSAVLCFENRVSSTGSGIFSRGAYNIYAIPIVNGQPGKITSLEFEILRIADAEAAAKAETGQFKDIPDFYAHISDQGMDDDLTFNNANQIVIDCWCTSTPRDPSTGFAKTGTTTHVMGLWDPILGKFVQQSHAPVTASN